MLFNSLHFAIFFPIVTSAFFVLRGGPRLAMLLLASAYFYMALVPAYILILAFLILVDFYAARLIEAAEGARRRWWLIASLLANLGVLFYFKYANFVASQIDALLAGLGTSAALPLIRIALPVGLSFHTFQSMSYTIEVYRRRQIAERSLLRYSLYVLFFPQLVAGPIERPQNLLGQLHDSASSRFDAGLATSGLRLMLWGLLKKVVVADSLAAIVDRTYANVDSADSVALLVAAYAFSIQIYCDFSGYTDIARGAARVLGFDLMRNFDRPYEAASLGEFWRRWHISLSSWFRDYVYVPLGGSRHGLSVTVRNLVVVFLLSGVWHGANWTFLVWGAIHGAAVSIEAIWTRMRSRAVAPSPRRQLMKWFFTFHVVTLAWVFFRAPSLEAAWHYLARLGTGEGFSSLRGHNLGSSVEVILAFSAAAAVLLAESLDAKYDLAAGVSKAPRAARWAAYYAAVVVLLAAAGSPQQFIYFQF